MSTILEALKKSEQERKQKSVPMLTDKAPPKESSRWPWVVISIVLLFLTASLVYLFLQLPNSDSNASSTSSADSQVRVVDADSRAADIPFTVEVISWSPDLAKRFAVINGKMTRVGDYLSPGIKVEGITESSVVFNHRGIRKELKP